jgi:hypothetical protein
LVVVVMVFHGSFGEVAAVGDGPFVVDLDQDCAGEAQQGLGVGEDPDDVGAAFDLLVDPFQGVGGPDLLPVRPGRTVKASRSVSASVSMVSTTGNWRPSMVAIMSSWERTCSASGWAKIVRIAAATISALPFGDPGEDVAQEVHPAALPTGIASEHRPDRGLEAFVGIRDDQLHPVQAAGLQRAQESGPERPVLAVADVEPRTSRLPSARTAVATTTAWETTRRLTRALQ